MNVHVSDTQKYMKLDSSLTNMELPKIWLDTMHWKK